MVAAPQYAIFNFVGLRTRKTYPVDAYFSDAVGALVRFDGGGGASTTSPEYWMAPGEPVVLVDFAQVTGMTDTTKCEITINGRPVGGFMRYVMHLTTNATRPRIAQGIPAGGAFRVIQRA